MNIVKNYNSIRLCRETRLILVVLWCCWHFDAVTFILGETRITIYPCLIAKSVIRINIQLLIKFSNHRKYLIIHFLSNTFLAFLLALIFFSFRNFINLPSSLYAVILVSGSAIRFKSAINLLLVCTFADPSGTRSFQKIFVPFFLLLILCFSGRQSGRQMDCRVNTILSLSL
ncbi:hypothetical protein QFZ20_002135 [Flavobacterium sp. W4I14]|nr:hypothetical protein [Flavobacterium sp. W4I14]